jgi:hypothetical protein
MKVTEVADGNLPFYLVEKCVPIGTVGCPSTLSLTVIHAGHSYTMELLILPSVCPPTFV